MLWISFLLINPSSFCAPPGERPYQCQTCERTFTLKHSLVRHQRIHLKPRGADGASAANDDASEDGDSCTQTPPSTCPPSENESECGSGAAGGKELEEEDMKEEGEKGDGAESATLEEESPAKQVESCANSEPSTAVASEDAEEKSKLSAESVTQQPSADTAPSKQATETKTTTSDDLKSTPNSNLSKDPSSSSSSSLPGESVAAAPAEGFIQGLLEIHAKPPLEHILPNGEPPLVGVDWGETLPGCLNQRHHSAICRKDATPLMMMMMMQKPARKTFFDRKTKTSFSWSALLLVLLLRDVFCYIFICIITEDGSNFYSFLWWQWFALLFLCGESIFQQ